MEVHLLIDAHGQRTDHATTSACRIVCMLELIGECDCADAETTQNNQGFDPSSVQLACFRALFIALALCLRGEKSRGAGSITLFREGREWALLSPLILPRPSLQSTPLMHQARGRVCRQATRGVANRWGVGSLANSPNGLGPSPQRHAKRGTHSSN